MTGAIDTWLLLPQLVGFNGSLAPYCYALLRFCTSVVIRHFLFGGTAATAKAALGGLGPDLFVAMAYAIGCVELLGAIFFAVGLLTWLGAFSIVVEMSVIVSVLLWPNGYFWTIHGFEYALLWKAITKTGCVATPPPMLRWW